VFAVLVALVTDPALATEAHNAMEKYTWLVWVAGILVSSLKARALRAPRRAASEVVLGEGESGWNLILVFFFKK
jgi:hypothetical protein